MEETTLEEWANHYHSSDEMREVFCAQSDALKRTHRSGYYVTDFNLDQILLDTNSSKKMITFKNVNVLPKGEEEYYRHKNVKTECFQEVGIYCSMLSDLHVEFTPTFLKENFERFAPFIPEQDFLFYKKVFVYDAMIYLCDYIVKSAEKEVNQLENELKEEAGGRAFNKSTLQGRMSAKEESVLPESTSQSAFVYTFVLPFVVFTLSLLIPLFIGFFALLS